MPRIGHRRNDPTDVKVFILNPEGNYLTAAPDGLRFTPDRSRALIFDFRADQVAEQLREIQTVHGLVLRAEPVPLAEIYETCDRCKEQTLSLRRLPAPGGGQPRDQNRPKNFGKTLLTWPASLVAFPLF
jgi:hypothetical protein